MTMLTFFERLKLTFSSFGRFWPIFGFCAVWAYFLLLSKFDLWRFCTTLIKNQFSSKKRFLLCIGNFCYTTIFVVTRILWTNYLKTHCFWSLAMKTISKRFSVVSPVFDIYLVFLAIWPYCLFSAGFNWFEAFYVNIWINQMFLIKRNLFCCLVTTITSERVLVVWQFSTFFTNFQFCCCFAELLVF